jgi:MFS family permease
LGNRTFRRLWAAQFCATTAVYALSLAGIILVEEQAQSSAWTAVAVLSAILPAFLGSLVAGAVVDRLGRVPVLIGSHAGRALAALAFWIVATLLPPGWTLFAVFGAITMLALLTQFAMTAEFALLPDVVGQARLIPANTLFQLSMLAGEGLGVILLAPLVIKLTGVPAVGLLAALICLLSLALVTALHRERAGAVRDTQRRMDWTALGSDLQAGWHTIARDRVLSLVVLQATLAAALLLILVSLLPGLLSRHLGLGVEDAPFLLFPGGIGFGLGAIVVNRWQARLRRQAWIAWGLIGLGIGLGLALALVIIPARTVLQERPPPELRGRVISAQLALGNAAAVLPLLMGGALADQWGIRPVLGLLGLLALGAGAVGLHYARPPVSE